MVTGAGEEHGREADGRPLNPGNLETLAPGRDGTGCPRLSRAGMAMRWLGRGIPGLPDGAGAGGRTLRSACWRNALTRAIAAAWPANPGKQEPGGGTFRRR